MVAGEAVATETHEEYHLGGILNQLKIQVDNPICILNQHLAQTLLIASNNTMMYELYLKGTQLDVLFQRLDDSIDSGEAMESCVTVLAEVCVLFWIQFCLHFYYLVCIEKFPF